MDVHLNHEPSQTRFLELASLTAPPRDLHVPTALHPILSVLSLQNTRNFLFSPTPLHIQHLLSASLAQRSMLCSTTFTGIDLHSPPPSASQLCGESHHHAGYHLFVPASRTDCTTFGVGICIAAATVHTPYLAKTVRRHKMETNFRFVLDAQNRTLLILYDAVEDNCYMLLSRRAASTRSDTMCTVIVSREGFRELALRNGDIGAPDLLPTILMLEDMAFVTPCTLCNASDCNCDFAIPAKGRLDFGAFIMSMALFIATGTSTAVRLNAVPGMGKPVYKKAIMGTRGSLQGVMDMNVVEYLRSWSIKQFTQELKQHPLECSQLMPYTKETIEQESTPNQMESRDQEVEDAVVGNRIEMEEIFESEERNMGWEPLPEITLTEDCIRLPSHSLGSLPRDDTGAAGIVAQTFHDGGAQKSQSSRQSQYELGRLVDVVERPIRRLCAEGKQIDSSDKRDVGELAEDLEDATRRERNRAAARRSAMREKTGKEKLANELMSNYEKIGKLKTRERWLRQENMALRDAVLQQLDKYAKQITTSRFI